MMKSAILMSAAALLATAVPASATVLINFDTPTGPPTTLTDGPDGNTRIYTATVDGKAVTVQARGWTISNGALREAFLGAYSGKHGGLGVTNAHEGNGGAHRHTVDNSDTTDLVTFEFSDVVTLKNMFLNAYGDTDSQVVFGNVGAGAVEALANQPLGNIAALLSGSFMVHGTPAAYTHVLDTGTSAGNF